MSVATGHTTQASTTADSPSLRSRASAKLKEKLLFVSMVRSLMQFAAQAEDPIEEAKSQRHVMNQMGAKRIGSLAIGIGVVGIVLNQMSNLDVVGNSTGVIDVSSIFQVAGQGLNLLVIGVIIAAAAVLLSLWSGF